MMSEQNAELCVALISLSSKRVAVWIEILECSSSRRQLCEGDVFIISPPLWQDAGEERRVGTI